MAERLKQLGSPERQHNGIEGHHGHSLRYTKIHKSGRIRYINVSTIELQLSDELEVRRHGRRGETSNQKGLHETIGSRPVMMQASKSCPTRKRPGEKRDVVRSWWFARVGVQFSSDTSSRGPNQLSEKGGGGRGQAEAIRSKGRPISRPSRELWRKGLPTH